MRVPQTEEEHEHFAQVIGHKWTVRATPLLAGGWFYTAQCQERGCPARVQHYTHGIAPSVGCLRDHRNYAMPCESRTVVLGLVRSPSQRQSKSDFFDVVRGHGHLPMRRPQATLVLAEPWDPGVVAVDASTAESGGRSAWAAVTGAGWVFYGTDEHDHRMHVLEARGLVHAIRNMPVEVPKRIMCDNRSVVELFNSVGKSKRRFKELAASYPQDVVGNFAGGLASLHRQGGGLEVVWKRRVSDELMEHADRIAACVRRTGRDLSALVEWQEDDPGTAQTQYQIHRASHEQNLRRWNEFLEQEKKAR